MKVFTIFFAVAIGRALGVNSIQGRATSDYAVSTAKPATAPESVASGPAGGFNAAKYQSPPYVAPQKTQYSPAQQLNYLVQPTYKYLSQPTPASPAVSFVPQQAQPQPQYTPQSVAYNPQPLTRIAPIPQKIAYAPVQAQIPTSVPYSLAGDVSSFKYTSPLVSYSNLGLIQQSVGKSQGAAPQEAPVRPQYTPQSPQPPSAPSPAPQAVNYAQPQQFIYRPRLQLPQFAYNPAPQQPAPAAAPKLIYSQTPQTFANVPRIQQVYPASTQKLAASVPQRLLYTHPQQVAYTPVQVAPQPVQPEHSVPQPVYVVAPQYQLNRVFGQQA